VTINELVDELNQLLNTDIDPQYDDPRPGDVMHSHANISKAEKLLDYNPMSGFTDGLEQTIEYYHEG